MYRLSEAEIGCSLAEAAERNFYEAWLREAAAKPNSMHVVYINTSLVTKALSHVRLGLWRLAVCINSKSKSR